MRLAMTSSDIVREVTMYCLRRKGKCFDGWKPEIVFRYVAFHFLAGTLEIIRDGRAILGVAVGYTGDASYFWERAGKPFDWTLPPAGNTLYLAEIIASKKAVERLWKRALEKYPWINSILTNRRGKLVEVHMSQLERLARLEGV